MKTSTTIPIAICLGGIILAGAVYLSLRPEPSTKSARGNPSLVRPVDSTDHILGNPAAKVFIVEYSDFDCTFCKDFDRVLRQIIANQGVEGSVAWAYRQFPIVELHPNARKHAEAVECAAKVGGNDAFWEFADALFTGQPTNPSLYGSIAKNIGINADAFAACYQNAATEVGARITADIENGKLAGAYGTPYALILVSGEAPVVIDGAYSYEAMKKLVDEAVAKAY